MKFISSIILIIYTTCVSSKNIFLKHGEELSLTCSLPSFIMADRVVLLRGNNMTPVKEIFINDSEKDNCY
nr:CPPV351 immunoglobulin-like domain protein [Cooks petrelpox virus]